MLWHEVVFVTLPYRGTPLTRKSPPPQDRRRPLGIVLLQGARGALFLLSEVPLYDWLSGISTRILAEMSVRGLSS